MASAEEKTTTKKPQWLEEDEEHNTVCAERKTKRKNTVKSWSAERKKTITVYFQHEIGITSNLPKALDWSNPSCTFSMHTFITAPPPFFIPTPPPPLPHRGLSHRHPTAMSFYVHVCICLFCTLCCPNEDFSPWEIWVNFPPPKESQLQQSRATQP